MFLAVYTKLCLILADHLYNFLNKTYRVYHYLYIQFYCFLDDNMNKEKKWAHGPLIV